SMLCRLFGEEMRKARHGFILNVSSISAVMPYPGISLYGPSKTYMRYFTRALRSEMKQYNIHVTCLIPGATATALYDPNRVNLSLAKRLGVMQSAEKVAKTGLKSLFKNQAESIPGILNKITVGVLPFIPAGVARLIHQKTKILNVGNQALGCVLTILFESKVGNKKIPPLLAGPVYHIVKYGNKSELLLFIVF